MAYIVSVIQTKGGATKTTTSINLLGALLECGYKVVLCDMDKDKPDAIYWSDLGNSLREHVIPLYEDNPKDTLHKLCLEYEFIIIDTPPVTELKHRGVEQIYVACVDGLKGFPETINSIFPKTIVQLCIVHMIRNSVKYYHTKI